MAITAVVVAFLPLLSHECSIIKVFLSIAILVDRMIFR
jgi:hypothetical protein